MLPTIIIDTREQDALPIEFPTVRAGLYSGDYTVLGLERCFAVERKSLDDLASSVGTDRERFEHELQRLAGIRFRRLLIVGSEADLVAGNYRSRISPNAVLASLRAFEARYDLPIQFEPTPAAAARRVETWAKWFVREVITAAANVKAAGDQAALEANPNRVEANPYKGAGRHKGD